MRQQICAGLEHLGIEIDSELNQAKSHTERDIASEDSRIRILVIPTNEELEIATQTAALIS